MGYGWPDSLHTQKLLSVEWRSKIRRILTRFGAVTLDVSAMVSGKFQPASLAISFALVKGRPVVSNRKAKLNAASLAVAKAIALAVAHIVAWKTVVK